MLVFKDKMRTRKTREWLSLFSRATDQTLSIDVARDRLIEFGEI